MKVILLNALRGLGRSSGLGALPPAVAQVQAVFDRLAEQYSQLVRTGGLTAEQLGRLQSAYDRALAAVSDLVEASDVVTAPIHLIERASEALDNLRKTIASESGLQWRHVAWVAGGVALLAAAVAIFGKARRARS